MVVKVIKPASTFHEIVCKNCAVTLQFVNNDITSRTKSDYSGGSDTYYEIRCPECKYMNDVKQRPYTDNKFIGTIIGGRGYLPGEEIPGEKKS